VPVRGQDPRLVAERLHAAMNAHDIDAFVACFDEDYSSEQPAHPDRAFRGREQVRRNWSAIFEGVPDFRSLLVRSVATGETEWSEWRWRGTQSDGTALDMAGVIVCGVRDGRMTWARLYVEPVEQSGAGIAAAVRGMAGEPPR
jgi:ketosteroid isomerase-like protein